jgi:predicted adenine nucleotide alpha hydrolase (AANH) superfamily ATPase
MPKNSLTGRNSQKGFLLHCCCAPCGIAVIDELRRNFNLTVFFYNPNIYPEAEYIKRKVEVIKVCGEWEVPMIDGDYEPEFWARAVRGLENEKQGGARCGKCFLLRLERTARFAAENNFDLFGTTLTMGRQKKSSAINSIGKAAGERLGVAYYDEDWKKRGRWERGRKMVEERNIYKQNYCGCRYSMKRAGFY